jgi:hypothetical protein
MKVTRPDAPAKLAPAVAALVQRLIEKSKQRKQENAA